MSLLRIKEPRDHHFKALQLSLAVHAMVLLVVIGVGSSSELTDKILVVDFCMEDSLHSGERAVAVSEIKPQRGILKQKADTAKEARTEQKDQNSTQEMRRQEALVLKSPEILETSVSEKPQVLSQIYPDASLADRRQNLTVNSIAHDISSGNTGPNDGSTVVDGAITTGSTIAYDGGSGGPNGLKKAEYLRKNFSYIRDMIQKRITYPALAKQMGWQGKVTVSFIIVSDGRTKDIEVKESSGRDVFDKNVIETIRIVSPFPAPPAEARIIIPILYRLN